MARRKARRWYRLDNASKIFPANSKGRDSNVFRFVCELKDNIDPAILQNALDRTTTSFPYFRSILRRGFFWMYFEQTNLLPVVHPENKPPCSRLFNPDVKNLLFDVSYYRNRINLEIFHALSDGVGSLHFLQQLAWEYITEKYNYDRESAEHLPYDASQIQKEEDSFSRHYRPDRKLVGKSRRVKAYQEKKTFLPESRIQVAIGRISLKESLAVSKKLGITLTCYLTAVLLLSYNQTMSWKDRKKPVILAIPVNLRQFFPSETTRNFFSLVNVEYLFTKEEEDFKNILDSVKQQFKEKITYDNLADRVQNLMSIERNPVIRGIPLLIKNPILRIANEIVQQESTTTLSNVGPISLPAFCKEHVLDFHVYTGTERTQLTLCSYEDRLNLCFSTSFAALEVQKNFFRYLAKDGLSAIISTSEQPEE